jgi:hypothetical protein
VACRGTKLDVPFELRARGLRLGGITLPEAPHCVMAGLGTLDVKDGTGRLENLKITWGAHTSLVSNLCPYRLKPARMEIPFTLETDVEPFVRLGLLDKGEGTMRATGSAKLLEERWEVASQLALDADYLMWPDGAALLTGVKFQGNLGYTCSAELAGRGALRIDEAIVAGASLLELSGPVTFEGGAVRVADFRGRLFDGQVTATGQADLLGPDLPGQVSVRVEELNLETFTREFNPPSVRLTGLANAEAILEWRSGRVRALHVSAVSTRGFTLNSDILKQWLLSEYVRSTLGAKVSEKVLVEVVGKQAQRPFDRAELTLDYQGERPAGKAVLRSRSLNLTLDLAIDPDALVEAMALYQRTRLKELAKFDVESVQSGQE